MRWNDSFQYHLFTTNRCNLNCVYCALPDKGPQEPRYDAKQLADLLSRSPYTQKIVLFGFMEPTMNMPFVERVIEEARGTPGVDFVMQTNGTRLHLIPKDVMEQFSLLFVSIDGDAYVHNRQRGKTFHGIIDNVIAMKAGFPGKLEAAITVTPAVNLFTSVLGLMNIFDSVTWQLVEDAEPVTDQFMREYRNQFGLGCLLDAERAGRGTSRLRPYHGLPRLHCESQGVRLCKLRDREEHRGHRVGWHRVLLPHGHEESQSRRGTA